MVKRTPRKKTPKPPSYARQADERGFYRVQFTVGQRLFGDENDGIVNITGSTLFMRHEDDDGDPQKETTVGSVNGFIIKNEEGVDLFDQCDAHSQTLLDVVSVLFDPETGELLEDVDRALDGVMASSVLVLDLVEVVPEHRGHGVGLAAASRFLETFSGGCGIAICKPFPLQFDCSRRDNAVWMEELEMASFAQNEDAATERLQAYWGRLGFDRLLDTPYWAMNLGYVRPTRIDLGLA